MIFERDLLIRDEINHDEIKKTLKNMYFNRVNQMFQKTINLKTIFNVFDEIFHGISKTEKLDKNLNNFYESYLIISSYYQHSQAGRGTLAARLLEKLGKPESMKFEFKLKKIPQLWGENINLNIPDSKNFQFDIVCRNKNSLSFCELKMKIYSGCTAGRLEVLREFREFIKFVYENDTFTNYIKKKNIDRILLIIGILFYIQGNEATIINDKEWGLCYNGLIRGKKTLIEELKNLDIKFNLKENTNNNRAFTITMRIKNIDFSIISVYGNEVINALFDGEQLHDIQYFKQVLESLLYDDIWLSQILTISERCVLSDFFKNYKRYNNYALFILRHKTLLDELKQNKESLNQITDKFLKLIKVEDPELFNITPFGVKLISSFINEYTLKSYLADLLQFISCLNLSYDLE